MSGDDVESSGLIGLLPVESGGNWHWWRVVDGSLSSVAGPESGGGDGAGAGRAITVLVPAALAPVRVRPMPAMPLPQALAAERLAVAGQGPVGLTPADERHVAVAASADGRSVLSASVAQADMDRWLAQCAELGFEPAAIVPAALVLPPPAGDDTVLAADLSGQPLARTREAAFAGDPALVEAIAGPEGQLHILDPAELDEALLAAHHGPALNLRQGQYAPRRVSVFLLPDWLRLARMAATAALLVLLLILIWTVKWNLDSSAREEEALAQAQKRFPAATDLATAERLVAGELTRRGAGAGGFAAPAAGLLSAMRPLPTIVLRDLGYNADGTLRFTAAAPKPDEINQLLVTLQRDGWKVTVPPSLAPDPTGATVAAITVRAP